jgi:hypothetical protein
LSFNARNVWLLLAFFLANVAQIVNEGIEDDVILGGKPQWIL